MKTLLNILFSVPVMWILASAAIIAIWTAQPTAKQALITPVAKIEQTKTEPMEATVEPKQPEPAKPEPITEPAPEPITVTKVIKEEPKQKTDTPTIPEETTLATAEPSEKSQATIQPEEPKVTQSIPTKTVAPQPIIYTLASAQQASQEKQYIKAEKIYLKLLADTPNSYKLSGLLGDIYFHLKDPEKAVVHYATAAKGLANAKKMSQFWRLVAFIRSIDPETAHKISYRYLRQRRTNQ
jgi:hypothetical protein